MDVQAFRDVATRLQPLRRMLNDLSLAADLAVQTDAEHRELRVAVEALRTQVDAYKTQAAQLEDSLPAQQAKVNANLAALQASYEDRACVLADKAKIAEANSEFRVKQAEALASAAEQATDSLVDMLKAEEQKAQGQLDAAKAAYETFLASVRVG